MKQNLLSTVRVVVSCVVFLCGIYPFCIWLAAKASINAEKIQIATANNQLVGYKLKDKYFSDDKYFSLVASPISREDNISDFYSSPGDVKNQVRRIALARRVDENKIYALIDLYTERHFPGPSEKVNVLKLNIALDELSGR